MHAVNKYISYFTNHSQKQKTQTEPETQLSLFSQSTHRSKIQEISIDVLKKCFEFLPQEQHPRLGIAFHITANSFWKAFLSQGFIREKLHCTQPGSYRKEYFQNPAARRLDLILSHKDAPKAIHNIAMICLEKFEQDTGKRICFDTSFWGNDHKQTHSLFTALIEDALKKYGSSFLEPELSQLDSSSLSLEEFIHICLSIFSDKIEGMTISEKRTLSKEYIQELIRQNVITLDEAKGLNANALSCLSSPSIRSFLEDQLVTLAHLGTSNRWKVELGLKIPMAEEKFRSGEMSFAQLENAFQAACLNTLVAISIIYTTCDILG